MNKNKEWLKKQMGLYKDGVGNCSFNEYTKGLNYAYETADDLINQLDEPEKVVIPKHVADYLEGCKENERNLFEVYESAHKEVSNWIFDAEKKTERIDIIAKAWLDGYTIKQEKRYRLKLNAPILGLSDVGMDYLNKYSGKKSFSLNDKSEGNGYQTSFIETELLQINETGFVRVEVAE